MSYDTGWFKSSRSAASSDGCVEVRMISDAVSVRDSKNPDGDHFTVTHPQWAAFLRTLR